MFSFLAWGAIQNQVKIQGIWREIQLDWHINIKELMAVFLAPQLLIPNYWNGHIQLSLDNTTTVAYLNHQGDKISPAFSPNHRDVILVPGKEHPLVSSPHASLKNLFADPLSHLENLSTEWMLN